jgi:hypothetical protein
MQIAIPEIKISDTGESNVWGSFHVKQLLL